MTEKEWINHLVETLLFYADPDSYFAISFATDPPCGDFANDFEYSERYRREMPGKRARKVLLEFADEKEKRGNQTSTITPRDVACN